MSEFQHEIIYFTGRVQGVGFRYTTLQIAKEFEVAGFVMNLPDGRVQLEVEGRPADVKPFTAAVQERMHGYIRKVEQKTVATRGGFQGFTIK